MTAPSFWPDALDKGAAATKDPKAAALMRRTATMLRERWASWEEELISRLCVLAAASIEHNVSAICDEVRLVSTLGKEASGYRLTLNINDDEDQTRDGGPCQINSIHNQPDAVVYSWHAAMGFIETLIARRVRKGEDPLQDFNARHESAEFDRYTIEAFRRVRRPHPTKPAPLPPGVPT